MAQKSYIVTQNFKSPVVQITGMPHKPQEVRFRNFQKGQIIRGEMKHSNNRPAFVLVDGVCVVPLSVLKELVTKEINYGADGSQDAKPPVKIEPIKDPKMKYLDGIVLGAIVGVAGAYLAEKQGWIAQPDKKNKIYGAMIGAALGLYAVYRFRISKRPKQKD